MGFWDVLLFNIAAILGPRWIAAAAHNGTSSISLWILAAVGFFIPTALVIVELSTRFPEEGGLYVWSKEAFGDFHGFVAGWTYWIYTVFYFPGLLMASAAMSGYVVGSRGALLAQDRTFLLVGSLVLLLVAVVLNIIGLNVGKWLQNAGGVSTYLPLLMLSGVAGLVWLRHGSVTNFTWANMMPHWSMDTVNFWSQMVFAFTGLELVSAMSQEIRDPRRTLPRAVLSAGALIAVIYIVGSLALRVGFVGVLAALLVSVGNAGGIGSTVAGIARVPFVVGIDRYLPAAFGKIHPRWKTPYVSIIVQATVSGIVLLLSQINETTRGAYQGLVDIAVILYFIPFLYMYAAAIKLAGRADRNGNPQAVLIPGGKFGVWLTCGIAFAVTFACIFFSLIPPADVTNKMFFEVKVAGASIAAIALGLGLYFRGARAKARESI